MSIRCPLLLLAALLTVVVWPFTSSTKSFSFSMSEGSRSPIERLKVPGNTPAYFCSDPETDLFVVERLDMFPMPPVAGLYVTVRIWGDFRIATGLRPAVIVNVTVDDYPSINYRFPLCDTYALDIWQPDEYGWPSGYRSCPPKADFAEIIYSTYIYSQFVSDGNNTIRAEFVTNENKSLFCVVGWLLFHK